VGVNDLVRLECRPDTIGALAAELTGFGPIEGEPQWLVSGVWLRAGTSDYLATPSTKVQFDGYIARPLAIDRADDFAARLKGDLPDIASRLVARHSRTRLPDPELPVRPPLSTVPAGYSMSVLIRVAARAAASHRVACALLFDWDASRLLVGTDISTLAMVFSQDEALIERYLAGCDSVPYKQYLEDLAR
jgi:hypothetical protein